MKIRSAEQKDQQEIAELYLCAFSDEENALVAKLASDLLEEEKNNDSIISLVATENNKIIGHLSLSPLSVENKQNFKGYILAPLAVLPKHQKQGIGKALIEESKKILEEKQINVFFVYGDPEYYKKFGFVSCEIKKYSPPYKLEYEFGWQIITFNAFPEENKVYKLSCVKSLCSADLW